MNLTYCTVATANKFKLLCNCIAEIFTSFQELCSLLLFETRKIHGFACCNERLQVNNSRVRR